MRKERRCSKNKTSFLAAFAIKKDVVIQFSNFERKGYKIKKRSFERFTVPFL